MRAGFLSLGCKVNYYETEKMKQQFVQAGYTVVAFEEAADVYIINTCTVTNIADRKSRKMLHRARRKNDKGIVVAVGCYADSATRRGERDSSVDLFISNQDKERIVELVTAHLEKNASEAALLQHEKNAKDDREKEGKNEIVQPVCEVPQMKQGEVSGEAAAQSHTRAYVKVQSGCNQYCTYCIIPYVRGELTSRPKDEVVAEVEKLAAEGIREVVITGIHLSSYGVDRQGEKNFLALEGKPLLTLLQGVASVKGIERVRLGSLEPRIITEDFARELAKIPEICPHFHLSLQSGCDEILRRMNRHYTTQEYLQGLAILRRHFLEPAITTDIIVGFPGETEKEFEETCAFMEKAAFAQVHVFKYSRRKGTMADAMENQLSESVKAERSDRLLALEKDCRMAYQRQFMDGETAVLFEEITQIGDKQYLTGYNERYVRVVVDGEAIGEADRYCNQIVSVRIKGYVNGETLEGEFAAVD